MTSNNLLTLKNLCSKVVRNNYCFNDLPYFVKEILFNDYIKELNIIIKPPNDFKEFILSNKIEWKTDLYDKKMRSILHNWSDVFLLHHNSYGITKYHKEKYMIIQKPINWIWNKNSIKIIFPSNQIYKKYFCKETTEDKCIIC